ncbi:MAG: DUF1592 domain-containing protein, partial [Planctomycetaceae bacterium]|nr:DUF1592 domain-containing protein [Planctomycetaceae bacterium]
QIRDVEHDRRDAEPRHLAAVLQFAARAFRRPLSQEETDSIRSTYTALRSTDGMTHADAMNELVVSILMSPHFCLRTDLIATGPEAQALTDIELASRLSYLLWASQPDQELIDLAVAGKLRQPDTLIEQTRRMLRDPRVAGFATEFTGQWLDFRRFEEHNSVDRGRFPEFTDELRSAMFQEPVQFVTDLLQHDRPVNEFLDARYTFANKSLARHYGLPFPEDTPREEWLRFENADQVGRGGLLPMAVFLTRNSPGLRTSPVKRGYWVVRRLLGQHIPAPPPNVPELPADEAALGERTLRQTLAQHREHASCAGCHEKFDSMGLAFEGYGPIGERRGLDLGGRPVDDQADFPDGSNGTGINGLRTYLQQNRREDFVENLCRKLVSYGLGRSLILSDELLIREMQQQLHEQNGRCGSLIETLVTSPQFLNKRGQAQRKHAD